MRLGKEWKRKLSSAPVTMTILKYMIMNSMDIQIKPMVRRIFFRLLFLLEAVKVKDVAKLIYEDTRRI